MIDQPRRQMNAKYPGHCEFCGREIGKGDRIAYSEENDAWVHLHCWVDDRAEPEEED